MEHTFDTVLRRLRRSGFDANFVRTALLPEWWDELSSADPTLLPEVEIRVARFLGKSVSQIRSNAPLAPEVPPQARLRRPRNDDPRRVIPSAHAAQEIAGAVGRALRHPSAPRLPDRNPENWRQELLRGAPRVTLGVLIRDLWHRGIPVVPVDVLPSPSFQGMACIVDDRPTVLLGHKHDEEGRVAFITAHEIAHLVAGEVVIDQPIVDQEAAGALDASERRADQFATRVLVGEEPTAELVGQDFRELARAAARQERARGAEASFLLFAWAAATNDYATATRAVKALYRSSGARRLLREQLEHHIDLEAASESDRLLLRCVVGDAELAPSSLG